MHDQCWTNHFAPLFARPSLALRSPFARPSLALRLTFEVSESLEVAK